MKILKKIGRALLFPHIAVLIILLPVATAFLIYTMVFVGTQTVQAYIAYTLAAYTLTILCFRIPRIVAFARAFKNENKYVKMFREDVHLRVNISLYGSFVWNVAYSVFQLCLGLYHKSFWYYSLAVYYIFLASLRFYLSRHTRKHKPSERIREELVRYRTCGIVFLCMNMALTLIIFFMIYWNRTFHHHEITTIAMAAYTFTTFIVAIVSIVKYRKYQSPVLSATKAISLAAACVSMITLTSTMLTTFGDGQNDELFRKIMLGSLGGAVSAFIIIMAIYMIVRANKELKTTGGQNERTE